MFDDNKYASDAEDELAKLDDERTHDGLAHTLAIVGAAITNGLLALGAEVAELRKAVSEAPIEITGLDDLVSTVSDVGSSVDGLAIEVGSIGRQLDHPLPGRRTA